MPLYAPFIPIEKLPTSRLMCSSKRLSEGMARLSDLPKMTFQASADLAIDAQSDEG